MESKDAITLKRDCQVISIPNGTHGSLPAGAHVRVMQRLGGSITVMDARGAMFRVDAIDSDALGLEVPAAPAAPSALGGPFNEKQVWDTLKTIFDPEIPVNIVDLGLVYRCDITPLGNGERSVQVDMTLTAPGCGMGEILVQDAQEKIAVIPTISDVVVELVFDPPWNQSMMSDEARLQTGLM
jgi:probable FeS assembly SUF system protein SufT